MTRLTSLCGLYDDSRCRESATLTGTMRFERFWKFVKRHRVSITELSLLALFLCVATLLTFYIDVFMEEGRVTAQQEVIELDEALLLGGLLTVGLLVFCTRRYLAQRAETRRRITAEQEVRKLAFQDALTGLPNRRQFDTALKTAIGSPPRAGALHAVLLMDLNGFKQINDTHGHGVGDEVLVVVAQRLLRAMRSSDLLARFGGDEFAILAQHLNGADAVANIARRVMIALESPIDLGRKRLSVGIGVGICLIPNDARDVTEAMRRADVALYRAKAERRSAMRFFEAEMDRHVSERDRLETLLRAAIAADEIRTVFQPSIDLQSGRVRGFEALLRWSHPELGDIPAQRFLAIADETGLIHEIAARQLQVACAAAARWPKDVHLAVDVFPAQLKDRDLAARVLRILAEHGVETRRLELEITESALVQHLDAATDLFTPLRAAGVRITLDNFGTGYSTLYHLRSFKLDKVKIDRRFVGELASTPDAVRVVNALVGFGNGLGLQIAAEGIEAPGANDLLRLSGCQEGQGAWLSSPLDATETLRLIESDADQPSTASRSTTGLERPAA